MKMLQYKSHVMTQGFKKTTWVFFLEFQCSLQQRYFGVFLKALNSFLWGVKLCGVNTS
jgi:hypothetical protein